MAGDQAHLAALQVGEGTEAVVFQLRNPVGMEQDLAAQAGTHGGDDR